MTTVEMKEYWTKERVINLVKNSDETIKCLKALEEHYPKKMKKLFCCETEADVTELTCAIVDGLTVYEIDTVCEKLIPEWYYNQENMVANRCFIMAYGVRNEDVLIDITYILEEIRNGRI